MAASSESPESEIESSQSVIKISVKPSHGHLAPLIILYGITVTWTSLVGSSQALNTDKPGPFGFALGYTILVLLAVTGYYAAMVFGIMAHWNPRWASHPASEQMFLRWGMFWSHFVFVTRLTLVAAAEGMFFVILVSLATGNWGEQFGDLGSESFIWYSWIICSVLIHWWCERTNLGRSTIFRDPHYK